MRNSKPQQQRLSVVEVLPVDQRHRLFLVRRDNSEHLILIGGSSALVVESNIGERAAQSQPMREPAMAMQAPQQPVRDAPPPMREPPPPSREAPPMMREPAPARDMREAAPPREMRDAAPARDMRERESASLRAPPPPSSRDKAMRPSEADAPPAGPPPQRRPVEGRPPPPSAQDRPPRREPPAEPPPRRLDAGLAAAANALELALRKPFGGGRPSAQMDDDLDGQNGDQLDDLAAVEAAVTPFPAAARARNEEPAYESDSPSPPSPMPRLLGGQSRGGPPPAPGPRQPAEAGREMRAERGEAPARPTPFPGAVRAQRPQQGGPAPGQRPAFQGGPRSVQSGAPDLAVSRSDRPAPLSLEDEMASLLDEISGVRERG